MNTSEVFIDEIENYTFENVEDLKRNKFSFKEKQEEFKRINYIKQRGKLNSVFDNYFELKLFFSWISSYQFQMEEKQFYFLFFEEYLDLVKFFQK